MSGIRLSDDWDDPGWVMVPRNILRDRSLSFKAMGIVSYLASHQAGFSITREFLYGASATGKDAVETGLKELRESGYLTVERGRDARGCLTKEADYVLHRQPRQREISLSPENPDAGDAYVRVFPNLAEPESGQPATKRDTSSKENPELQDTPQAPQGGKASRRRRSHKEHSAFDAFWGVYHGEAKKLGRPAGSRQAASVSFSRAMEDATAEEVMVGVMPYFRSHDPRRGFVKHATTWLNQRGWADEYLPYVGPSAMALPLQGIDDYAEDPFAA